MGKAPVTQSVIELIEPGLLAKGLELVDVEFKKEGKNWVLRVFIDKEGGITLEDCQSISGLVGDLIEVEEVLNNMQSIDGIEFSFNSDVKDIFYYLDENLKKFRFSMISQGGPESKILNISKDVEEKFMFSMVCRRGVEGRCE